MLVDQAKVAVCGFCRVYKACWCPGGAESSRKFAGNVSGFADSGGQHFAIARLQNFDGTDEVVVDIDRGDCLCLCVQNRPHAFSDFHLMLL